MIFDIIDHKIEDMRNLCRLELTKAKQDQQSATDAKYSSLVNQVNNFCLALAYARDNLQFSISETIQPALLSLLESLKCATSTGYADRDSVSKAENDFKSIQADTKNEWEKHFSNYTSTTINTLKVISGIDAEGINGCIAEIKAAESWTIDISKLTTLQKAIDSAVELINSLNMDQETILFLTKMTSGEASIADLNENVLNWIKKEGLEAKIKLSFLSR